MAMQVFDALPLVALLGGEYLCIHGGISPSFETLQSVDAIDRFMEVPEEGMLCDLLWADPADDDIAVRTEFKQNFDRGCAVEFGYEPIKKVLHAVGAKMLVRGHQV